jgi:hypothetical protein
MSAVNVRLLLPETLWLEPEHFEQARQIRNPSNDEQQQWQAYLNVLATLAFETWLKERLPEQPIQQSSEVIAEMNYLNVGEFKLGLIATEHVLDEIVSLPTAVEQPSFAAHFYVVLEVLEDQEQVVIRGFLRHDELVAHCDRLISPGLQSELCAIPLAAFDAEINHLVFYIQHSEPSAIPLPAVSTRSIAAPLSIDLSRIKTRLGQWLQGVLDEGWQTIDTLINPEANLAWSTRQTSLGAKGGKLINFGVQLDNQTVALLVTVTPESEGKIGLNIQVLPAGGAQILPAQLKLTLLSSTDKILQEVQSREQDNYIQLKPFKGKPGVNFSVEVSLNNINVREVFEL